MKNFLSVQLQDDDSAVVTGRMALRQGLEFTVTMRTSNPGPSDTFLGMQIQLLDVLLEDLAKMRNGLQTEARAAGQ